MGRQEGQDQTGGITLPATSLGITAVTTVTLNRKEVVVEKLNDFKWDDAPAIRARVAAKYGKVPFQIALELPDGINCTIGFYTSAAKAKPRE